MGKASDIGRHNQDWQASETRLIRGSTYRDCSTICVIPTRGVIPSRVVQNWFNLMTPMNQKFLRMLVSNMEVAEAYNVAIQQILHNPELRKWPYILTLEEDNLPPPDGLVKLIESIQGYDAVGGLYWTKGEAGQPMCYGRPEDMPLSFRPWLPPQDTIARCNGLGMGFTLFKTKMFTDERIERPWFRTVQDYTPGVGSRVYTQDLYFFEKAAKAGYRFACDTRVKVGHYDVNSDVVW